MLEILTLILLAILFFVFPAIIGLSKSHKVKVIGFSINLLLSLIIFIIVIIVY